jgi:hypothetical protein
MDISTVMTPENELSACSSNQLQLPSFQLKQVNILLDISKELEVSNSAKFLALQQKVWRDQSQSLSPQSLQGLVQNSEAQEENAFKKISGLKQLAKTALLNSPNAPQLVIAYVKNLVNGLFLDTIPNQVKYSFISSQIIILQILR